LFTLSRIKDGQLTILKIQLTKARSWVSDNMIANDMLWQHAFRRTSKEVDE